MTSTKAIFLYLAYTLAAAAFFLYLLFPETALKEYLNSRLAAIDPALAVQTARIRPTLPPGLKLSGVVISGNGTRLAHFDSARISPDLIDLLKGNQRFRFQTRLADGTINGRGGSETAEPPETLRVEADLSRIQLDRLDAVKALERFSLSGLLNGKIIHEGRPAMGLTSGALTVSDLRIVLKEPFLGISDLLMDQTEAEFSVNDRNLRLKALTFEGPLLQGQISGSIELRQPLAQSRLNLSGNAKPRPELFTRLPDTLPRALVNPRTLAARGVAFRIRGSIENPDFSMR